MDTGGQSTLIFLSMMKHIFTNYTYLLPTQAMHQCQDTAYLIHMALIFLQLMRFTAPTLIAFPGLKEADGGYMIVPVLL
uniref:Uncharacterized protein n=1 Tax=Plectus sambesii TaxID=2011161 RepID=A0A914XI03_9BILA